MSMTRALKQLNFVKSISCYRSTIKSFSYEGDELIKEVKLNNFAIGGSSMVILAGPCVIEDDTSIVFRTAEKLKEIAVKLELPYVFKASYDKANRTSIDSYRGVGIEKGLEILAQVKKEFDLPIVTDIHLPEEAQIAAEVADILQIPAFLSRQTDILVAAAKTGKIVNIKKGQFLAPQQMANSAKKVIDSGNDRVVLTDRGSCFGYGNLVSDMRAIPIMQNLGYPVIFDATHSVQLPGSGGTHTSGYCGLHGPCAIGPLGCPSSSFAAQRIHRDSGHR